MKNDKGYSTVVIIAIVVGALIIGSGGYYFAKSYYNREDKTKDAFLSTCYDEPDYFVVTRADLSGDAGDDILVKYKTGAEQKFTCDYKVAEGDFELLNTHLEDAVLVPYAQHFSNLKDNLMIVDEGTGSSRKFTIYDLDKKEKVFADNYSAGLFELQDNILNYWRKTNDVPNKDNCAKVEEYKELGGAKIEGKIALDIFDTGTAKEFNGFRCSVVE